jgi:hypothetical protein
VCRGDQAYVEVALVGSADRSDLLLLERPEQLGLERQRQVADLVEQQRAAIGLLEEADLVVASVGERALDVPEQRALQQRLRDRGAVDAHERLVATASTGVQRPRHELLAGAALTGHQHGGIGVRHAVELREEILHRRAVAEQLVEARGAGCLLAEHADLLLQRPVTERPFEDEREVVHLERLGDEVVRAGADGGDGRVEAAERSHHEDRHVRTVLDETDAQIDAVDLRHVQIREHHVELVVADHRKRSLGVGRPPALEATAAQIRLDQLAHVAIVVNDEDATLHSPRSRGRCTEKRLPRPGSLSTAIRPPCSRTMP